MKSLMFVVLGLALSGQLGVVETPGPVTRLVVPDQIDAGGFPKGADAVVVRRGGLAHSRLLIALDGGTGDGGFADLVGQVKGVCRAHGVGLEEVVKLNLYLGAEDPAMLRVVGEGLRSHWSPGGLPAITLVTSALPGGAMIAGDVVIRTDEEGDGKVTRFERDTATMPAGRDILYVSGRAAREGTLEEACASTMAQLFKVIGELGSSPADVVQVKAFIQPMSEWEKAEAAIERSFGDLGAPPIVWAEWTSSLPTEIELIAAAPDRARTPETVSYFTPSGDKASPVFSRVARVQSDTLIYTSGLDAAISADPLAEVKRVFARLGNLGDAAGSDLRHLVKATYYVSDPELSATLNEVRPGVYDPERPPAASKVVVESVGRKGKGLLMDFIAVPKAAGR